MISMQRLLALTGDRPQSVISDIWKPRLVALRDLGETNIPTLLAAWQEQGGRWAEVFVLYKALLASGDVPDRGLWRRIAEATGDPWIASKVPWVEALPALGNAMRRNIVWHAETFVADAAAVQATPTYWSSGLEAYRSAYQHAARTYLGMLMETLGEPVREISVPAPEHLRMRVNILIRPPYAGQWHGLYPCYLRINRFETWASVNADPDEVQAFILRIPGCRSVYAFRANRDVWFEWGKNGRTQERLVIPAGIPWCTFWSIDQCRDEVIDVEALEPCPTPGRQALVDSNYRW